ncbi:MAG: ABC transporter permease [Verrucomicrobiales bacterium]|nr:ABC transporter permease [Verrucomicrobiales bacterium]
MKSTTSNGSFARLFADYGMLLVLLLLGVFFSAATLEEQHPAGAAGARQLARDISRQFPPGASVLIAVRDTVEDAEFARELGTRLEAAGLVVTETVNGQPADIRRVLTRIAAGQDQLAVIAANQTTASWAVLQDAATDFPALARAKLVWPRSYRWPNFLKADNLLNIANQIAVIAIVAIGMTLVIITAGIDLSVGSLIALSAVVCTLFIRNLAGAEHAAAAGMVWCSLAAVGVCGVVGLFSGAMVTLFAIPPFITTLAMMLVASGLAFIVAQGQSIYQVPDSFIWLGRGSSLGLPNAVLLMLVLYAAAHFVMTRTVLGRYLYAVGGNAEAARLSGVPVKKVLLFAYTASGALAGLGGIVMASQLKSGSPTYGQMYELYVIAAVVVGGASLSGGEGKVLGTLIGAFIIAVIQNGMNLTGVESYTQKVVLGLVILGAVLLDILKRRGWQWLRRERVSSSQEAPHAADRPSNGRPFDPDKERGSSRSNQ